MTTVGIKLDVSENVLGYLEREAGNRRMSLDAVVSDVLAGLKLRKEQVLAGEFRPAHDVLDEIEREAENDADEG